MTSTYAVSLPRPLRLGASSPHKGVTGKEVSKQGYSYFVAERVYCGRVIDADRAQEMIQAGLQNDLRICIQTNVSRSVLVVVGREKHTELLVLEQTSPLLARRAK